MDEAMPEVWTRTKEEGEEDGEGKKEALQSGFGFTHQFRVELGLRIELLWCFTITVE